MGGLWALGVMEGAEGGVLPHEPIPAPPMFSGESPGVADTTSEEESLYGGLLERLRDTPKEEEAWPGLPRSQSYSEGSLQQASAPALPHAQSHHALLEDVPPPPPPPPPHCVETERKLLCDENGASVYEFLGGGRSQGRTQGI